MYGFISNNLQNQINKYLETKLIEIKYKHIEPINSIEKIVKEIDVDNIIIDSTCFFDDQVVIDFCYQLKIMKPKIRIIIICFNTQLITDIAMLGIYDIIDYQKKINLSNELDDILLNPKTLSDLQMYLNTSIIKNKSSNCQIIGGISYEANSYLTTFLLNYAQTFGDSKVCYCETSNTKNSLITFFDANRYASVLTYNDEKYKYLKCDILFCNNSRLKKDFLLTLLLNLRNKYDIVIFDLGSLPINKNNEELINNCDELLIFKAHNLYNNYYDYDTLFENKKNQYINYRELYDKNMTNIESEIIKAYINTNFKTKEKRKVNLVSDIKNIVQTIKTHTKNIGESN